MSTVDGDSVDRRASTDDGSTKRKRRAANHGYPGEEEGSPRLGSEPGKLLPELRACERVLRFVKDNKKLSWPFLEPVDPVALGIPDYFDVIKSPMDLATVESKLNRGLYSSVDDFAHDMRLIFQNCRAYNAAENPIHRMAVDLQAFFDSKFDTHVVRRLEEFRGKSHTYEQAAALSAVLPPSAEEPLAKKKKLAATSDSKKSSKAVSPRTVVSTDVSLVPMTYEQKKELTLRIGQLFEDELVEVAKIVQSAVAADSIGDDEEIEIDMEKLDTATLRKLEKYVNTAFKKREKAVKATVAHAHPRKKTVGYKSEVSDPKSRLSSVPSEAPPPSVGDDENDDSDDASAQPFSLGV
eukprot:ANDGO_02479.mRNA.1 Transcription factor GTE10